MKMLIVLLGVLFSISAIAADYFYGQTKSWTCTPPTTRTDDTPITGALTFSLYVRNEGNGQTWQFIDLPDCSGMVSLDSTYPEGSYTSWMTATETIVGIARESTESNIVPFDLHSDAPPNAPAGLTIQ